MIRRTTKIPGGAMCEVRAGHRSARASAHHTRVERIVHESPLRKHPELDLAPAHVLSAPESAWQKIDGCQRQYQHVVPLSLRHAFNWILFERPLHALPRRRLREGARGGGQVDSRFLRSRRNHQLSVEGKKPSRIAGKEADRPARSRCWRCEGSGLPGWRTAGTGGRARRSS
eukprot:3932844-Rhodomonas_salina.1